jgi:activator of 2-hydroxyglutaryl-CoA dehydratase/predicted nucleotide-binding protein (sugar kinase/HSP70/actin superfamily)
MHVPSATPPSDAHGDPALRLVLGVDLGKVTTCVAVGMIDGDGHLTVEQAHAERHLGEPLRPFFEVYRSLDPSAIAAVIATGAFGDRLAAPALGGLPEEIALERAAELLEGAHGPLNVVRIGGSGYSVLTRAADGRVEYETNERCSAGTGETVEGLCSRLGCTLDEAITLAATADDGIAVTSRCAVFAKSELTHFANQGEDHGRLFRGLFESVARNVHALYDRVKVDGPVVLVGHGALIGPLAEAFAALADAPVRVSDQAGVYEALGALQAAARQDRDEAVWPVDPSALVVERRGRIRSLIPAESGPGAVVRLAVPAAAARLTGFVVLGLDIGSTGSKAVLYDATSEAAVADVYRRTDGNPVEAAKRLVEELLGDGAREGRSGNGGSDVVAIGLTGSGRDAVATVMRAAYPELGERLTVLNEIVAHAAAAVRHDADAGRSLSIVEIGGQDAKFINVRDGRVLESDMNRVCSAGTGSFLEEQAIAHGLDDIARFGDLAVRSGDPPDLGQTCTVFVADVAAEALADGFTRDDVFAGLQYSVIKNYIGRVMGDRRLLDRVFFQGKPATNPSLARTLAAVTGREVVVPPNPGAMGALGIAMLAAEAAPAGGEAIDLARFLSAEVVERREGRCGDKQCRNLCRLETAIVKVAGERRRIVSGGTCPKYDTVASVGRKLPQDAPNPYRERDELLAAVIGEAGAATSAAAPAGPLSGTRVGLPYAHYLIDSLPFFVAWLTALGADVEVLRPAIETLAAGDRRCAAPGACAPVKIAHGLTGAATGAQASGAAPVDLLFAPKFINLPSGGAAGTYTCPIAQGTPEMIEAALVAEGPAVDRPSTGDGQPSPRVVRAVLFRKGARGFDDEDFAAELKEAARGLGASGAAARAAHRAALAAQERYEAGLGEIGERALAFAREEKVPVVLIVGETHVVHDAVINSGIHDLIAANGAVALPLDCFPVADTAPALGCVHWAGAGQTLRASLAATRAGDVFPLLLCAYGCGPNSFVEHLFDDLLADYPYTVLESDGHGGAAGYVTRVQAFLHAVQGFRESAAAGVAARASDTAAAAPSAAVVPEHRLARCETPVLRSLRHHRDRTFLFGNIGGDLGRHVAAAMRGAGLDARSVGATSPAALERARQGCSGKECLPYQLIWGTLAEYLAEHGDELGQNGAVFVSIGQGFQACRANLFPLAEQIQLERVGFGGRIDVMDFTLLFEDWALTSLAWGGVVAVDLLNMMRFYHYPTEPERGAADALFSAWAGRLEALLEEPRGDGGKAERLVHLGKSLDRVEELVGAAAGEFAALGDGGDGGDDLRTVFLCGDIYLRVDEWGNDDLQRKLADEGLRVVFEPFGAIFELLALRTVQDLGLTSRLGAKRAGTLKLMRGVIDRMLAAARKHEPWMFWNDVRDLDRESRVLLDGYPFGESIPTIGGALLTWRQRPIDGVVVVSPRGCGPALVSEAQLRRGADFPLLFVYNDGDPIDAARLAGFAWRLRGRPARRVTSHGRAAL